MTNLKYETSNTDATKASSTRSFVMKCGGSTLAALPESFFEDLKQLQNNGMQPVIVHAGALPYRII
ncbi:hypothetical protein JCM16418_4477 [Paenibacillus pini JCM 16418]|uniref:Acetylglutamate kinase n=1 Tax=Paenibacillus pini JCM 16418 TaxID=1236976 RepID=W7YSX1_9BACL|nr:hypothetical protein JCM16418_4477 [Paenibacillus pini JCM 16418]